MIQHKVLKGMDRLDAPKCSKSLVVSKWEHSVARNTEFFGFHECFQIRNHSLVFQGQWNGPVVLLCIDFCTLGYEEIRLGAMTSMGTQL